MKSAVKKLTRIFLCLLILTILLGLGSYIFLHNYVFLNGKPYSLQVQELSFYGKSLPDLDILAQLKNLKQLDLRNTRLTLGEHEWLQRQLPDCEILWQILFQGDYYAPDTQKLTLSDLDRADVIMLDYFPELTEIDARACRDYEAIGMLTERKPQCRILCMVEAGGRSWDQDTVNMTITDADMPELLRCLGALPKVEKIRFLGKLPATEEINRLQQLRPQVETDWMAQVCGRVYPKNQEHLDLSLKEIQNVKALKDQLLYFPYLKSLDFRGVRMGEEDREFLQTHYPNVEMIWDYDLDGTAVPVDTRVLDLSGHSLLTLGQVEDALPYLPDLQQIILCDCGLPNRELAEFNESLQDIRVIWNVWIGGRKTRTDEKYFAPNKWGLKLTDKNSYNLRYCTDMVCVDIGHSRNVTNCRWAEFMPELKYLILADSNVKDLTPLQNLKKLKFLELFLIPGQDLSPLLGCTALEDLNLCYVYTDPAPIQKMTWLKRLWWSGCWPARNALSQALPNTEKNFDTASSTGEGWREGKLYYEMRDFIGMGYMKG